MGKWVDVNFWYKNPSLVYSLLRGLRIFGDPFRGIVKLCERYKKMFWLLIWADRVILEKASSTRKAIRKTRSTERIQVAKLMFGEQLAELHIDGEVT
jgi:hypothetical protein